MLTQKGLPCDEQLLQLFYQLINLRLEPLARCWSLLGKSIRKDQLMPAHATRNEMIQLNKQFQAYINALFPQGNQPAIGMDNMLEILYQKIADVLQYMAQDERFHDSQLVFRLEMMTDIAFYYESSNAPSMLIARSNMENVKGCVMAWVNPAEITDTVLSWLRFRLQQIVYWYQRQGGFSKTHSKEARDLFFQADCKVDQPEDTVFMVMQCLQLVWKEGMKKSAVSTDAEFIEVLNRTPGKHTFSRQCGLLLQDMVKRLNNYKLSQSHRDELKSCAAISCFHLDLPDYEVDLSWLKEDPVVLLAGLKQKLDDLESKDEAIVHLRGVARMQEQFVQQQLVRPVAGYAAVISEMKRVVLQGGKEGKKFWMATQGKLFSEPKRLVELTELLAMAMSRPGRDVKVAR